MWYYKDGENEIGPVSKDDLKRLLKEKSIGGNTMLRSAKGSNWRPLKEMVKKKPKNPPPVSPAPPAPKPQPEPFIESNVPVTESVSPPPPPPSSSPDRPSGGSGPLSVKTCNFSFSGSGSEYFKIWIVNIVLSVLTLGIYSAWAKVRRKQYFYGNTSVDGSSFNYLANPVTILKGRVIVFLAFVLYSVVGEFVPLLGFGFLLIMLPLLPWLIVRALSFNARNSATRNIRFTFRGTYMQACKVYLFWPLLLPFTLGLIFPYLYYRQKQFLVDNSTYGTTPFQFDAEPKDYYGIFLRLLLPFLGTIVVAALVEFLLPSASLLFWVVFYLYGFAYISVKANNLLYNSSGLAKHRFESTMEVFPYLGIIITNTLATVFTLGLFHPFAQVRAYNYQISHLSLLADGSLSEFAAAEQESVNALGDEAAEFMDFDIGL